MGGIIGPAGGIIGNTSNALGIGGALGQVLNAGNPENLIPFNLASTAAPNNSISNLNALAQQLASQGNQYTGGAQQAVGGLGTAYNTILGAAQGTAPSMAQAQLQSGLDQNIAAQQAMANSGGLSGMMGRQYNSAQQAAQLQQGTANQAAQLRAYEMATARGQLPQAASNNFANQFNASNALNQMALGGYGQAGQIGTNISSLQQGAYNQLSGAQAGVLGGAASGAGSALAAFAGNGSGGTSAGAGGAVGDGAETMAVAAKGGIVPGLSNSKENSYSNDKISAKLSPGEIVIPVSHSHSLESSIGFLKDLLDKKSKNPKSAQVEMFSVQRPVSSLSPLAKDLILSVTHINKRLSDVEKLILAMKPKKEAKND